MDNSGNGSDRYSSKKPAEIQFQREVNAVARRVIEEGIPLSDISLEVAGPELGRLIHAVKRRIIGVFRQIKENCNEHGHELVVPAFRTRIATLFNVAEWQLDPLMNERGSSQKAVGERVGEVRTTSGQLLTQERADKELLLLANVYIDKPNGDFLEQAKLTIERVFIGQCQNVHQQRKIIEIVANVGVKDLLYVETVGGLAMFNLNQDIFQQLNICSLLAEEDKQSSRSGQMRAVTAPSGVVSVPIGKIDLASRPGKSSPGRDKPSAQKKKSLSSDEIRALNLAWDDVDWNED